MTRPAVPRLAEPMDLAPSDATAVRVVLTTSVVLTALGIAGARLAAEAPWVRFFDNLHWTASYIGAAILAWFGARRARPQDLVARRWFAWALTGYAVGQVVWDVQVAVGWNPFPGPSDLFFLMLGFGIGGGFLASLRSHLPRDNRRIITLDIVALSVAVLAVALLLYLPRQGEATIFQMVVIVAYPLVLLTALCIGIIHALALRLRLDRRWLLLLVALAMKSALWLRWNMLTLDGTLSDGGVLNACFSLAAIALGLGALDFEPVFSTEPRWRRHCERLLLLLPLAVVLGAALASTLAWTMPGLPRAVQLAVGFCTLLVLPLAIARQSLLIAERDRLLGAERQARATEEQYKALFSGASDAIALLADGAILDCNAATLRLFRCSRDALIGHSFTRFTPPRQPDGRDSAASIREQIEAALAGVPQFFEWRFVRDDGASFDVEVSLSRVMHGDRLVLQSIMRDVTERKRVAAAVAQARAQLQSVLDAATEFAVIATDPQGTITVFNVGAERMLGYAAEELVGRRTPDLLHVPEEMAATAAELEAKYGTSIRGFEVFVAEARHGVVHEREWTYVRKDGSRLPVSLVVTAARDPAGTITGFLGMATDLSERHRAEATRQRLEDQLRQATKLEAVGRLAGGIAHDFNNLLTAILGLAEVSLEEATPGTQLHADLVEIQRSSRRAASLTAQLLAFSRKQVVEPVVVDLNGLVAGAARMLRRLIGEDVDVTFAACDEPAPVRVDPTQMEQVLINLAVNARDAMPDGGRLICTTAVVAIDEAEAALHPGARPGHYVRLTVADDGHGMSDEVKAHIFEPFFTTKDRGRGTGLGLSMIYGIVTQGDGFIAVQSAVGQGTTFRIHLPLVDVVAETPWTTSSAVPRGHETVLLVEDEESVRILARRLLQRLGYHAIAVGNGDEALALLRNDALRVDLLLTDVIMPTMSGRALFDAVRAIRPDVRVLFMSGYTDDLIAHHGVLAQGTHFLQKPFTLDALGRKVRQALEDVSARS